MVAVDGSMADVFDAPKRQVLMASAVLVLLASRSRFVHLGSMLLRRDRLTGAAAAWLAWRGLSLLFTSDWSAGRDSVLACACLFAMFMALRTLVPLSCRMAVFHSLLAGAMVSTCLALAQYYGFDGSLLRALEVPGICDPTYLVKPFRPSSAPFLHGLAGNRNKLAGLLGPLAVCCATLSFTGRKVRYFPFMTLFLIAVVVSYCRGVWIACCLAMVSVYAIGRKRLPQLPWNGWLVSMVLHGAGLFLMFGFPGKGPLPVSAGILCVGISLVLFLRCIRCGWLVQASMDRASPGNEAGTAGCTGMSDRRVAMGLIVLVCLASVYAWSSGTLGLGRARYDAVQRFVRLFDLNRSGPLQRILIWRASLVMMTRSGFRLLFGGGAGSYETGFLRAQLDVIEGPGGERYLTKVGRARYAHDVILQICCENGLVGLGLASWMFLAWSAAAANELLRRSKGEGSPGSKEGALECSTDFRAGTVLASIGGIAAVIIHNLVSFTIYTVPVALMTVLLASLSSRAGSGFHAEASRTCGPFRRNVYALVSLSFALLLAQFLAASWRKQHDWGRGLVLLKDRADRACVALASALEMDPYDLRLRFDFGRALLNAGAPVRALEQFRRVLGHGLMAGALLNSGVCLLALGRTGEAESVLQYCLRVKPDYAGALGLLVPRLLKTGRKERALELVLRALKAAPYDRDVLYWAAWTFYAVGKTGEACNRAEDLFSLHPGGRSASLLLKFCLADGRIARAVEVFRLAISHGAHRRALVNRLSPGEHRRLRAAIGGAESVEPDDTVWPGRSTVPRRRTEP